ncbi:NifU family protein [Halpernia frigidisoli]|uniref:Fe-S cluster biogenesis protein NfuA, 4Fe-4S-binding domain n=1 Tax=Halpernia frigidisoli TaxID=1125876 RepID=A0A1I3G1S0_9FLAO|nr:NifU family protein [Halpernia frigidisoli]SFI17101.1 Fe-S cluster biogenesis protein NfuA, 4Fe-4S-binding domain [Halpernia frigidisoli]
MQQILIEPTENKKVMKFVTDYTLIPGSVELDRDSDLSEIPLAKELFKFPFVEKIFITANFIAIAKQDSVEWEHVIEGLKNIIEDELLANPRIYQQKKRELFQVYSEMTPNPNVMKFVSNRFLMEGFVEVKTKESSVVVPLAEALYNEFDFVKEVFISDNFVAVTKDETVQWHEVMVAVRALISDFLQEGKTVSHAKPQSHEKPVENLIERDYTETEQKISDILNEYVSPAVENDGGKISLIEYVAESKTAKMLLQGACSSCPSSTATLKGGIENILKQFLPEVVEHVEAVNG